LPELSLSYDFCCIPYAPWCLVDPFASSAFRIPIIDTFAISKNQHIPIEQFLLRDEVELSMDTLCYLNVFVHSYS